MNLLQELHPAKLETQGYGSSEFWVANRLEDFMDKYGDYLFFSANWLPTGLLSYLDEGNWIRGAGSSEMAWKDLVFGGLAGVLCQFMKRAINSCKVRLSFLYTSVLTISVLSLI